MATKIITKHSNTAKDPQPDDIERAELAIDLERRKIFTKDNADQVIELGGSPDADNYGHWKLQVDYGTPYEVVSGATANFEGTNGIKVTRTGDTVTIDGSELDLDEEADNYQYWQYKVDGFSTTNVLSTQLLDFQSGDGIDITKEGYGIKISATGGGSGGGVTISATEPTDKTEGMMWMDTASTPAVVWIWDGAAWVEFPFVGGGGSDGSGSSGPKLPELQYLVIGGGGSGGYGWRRQQTPNTTVGFPGGGGAGGYRTNVPGDRSGQDSDPEVTPSALTNIPAYSQFAIKVGKGGGATQIVYDDGNAWMLAQQNGQPSSIELDGAVIVRAEGGGAGGMTKSGIGGDYTKATDGGSGGGGAGGDNSRFGLGTANQGFDGRNYNPAGSTDSGGGGGSGAGARAERDPNNNNRDGCDGGLGLISSIDGTNTRRAGGGGGAASNTRVQGSALLWGGGNGLHTSTQNPTPNNGRDNTGGGGGATYTSNNTAGIVGPTAKGGSGIVIIRYLGPQVCFGGEVTTHNGYTVHTFKSDGVFTVGSLT